MRLTNETILKSKMENHQKNLKNKKNVSSYKILNNIKLNKGKLEKDTLSFGAPVKNMRIHGENRLITVRHDIFKDFSKVAQKLSESTKALFKNINTQGRSFIDAFDELDINTRKKVPSLSIPNIINFNEDKIVAVKTIDSKNYTAILRPNNESNNMDDVISESSFIEDPYILSDLNVRIQKLSKNSFDLSEDFTILKTSSKLLDPEDETDLVVTNDGTYVETENSGYLIQDINDTKLPFIAHIDNATYAKQINHELLLVEKIKSDKELSNFMMNIMIHEIIPYTLKDKFDFNETDNAIRLIQNIEEIATNRIKTGSNPASFLNVFELKNAVYQELRKKFIENFLNVEKEGNKLILDTTQWDEEKYSDFNEFNNEFLNLVFKNITNIKGNLTISQNHNIDLSSLKTIDGSLTILENSNVEAPNIKVIKGNLIIKNSKANMQNLEQVNIIRRDNNSKVKIPVKVEQDVLNREFGVTNNILTINPLKTNELFENRSTEQLNLLFQNITTINNDFSVENQQNLKLPSLEKINGSLIIKNANNISIPKLKVIKENLNIENSDCVDLSSLNNIGLDYIEENSNKIFIKHTLKKEMLDRQEEKKEKEFAKRRIAPILDSGMSLEQQKLQFEKEIALEKLYTERAHQERMDKLNEKKVIMQNAHLERESQLKKDYLGIMDKHLTNFENLEKKKIEYNKQIEMARLEIEDAHFKINKHLEELAISKEEKEQALFIEYQNKLVEKEMKQTQMWIDFAYAQLEQEEEEHQDEMRLQLLQIQNEYRLKVEEYKQIQNQQILQIEDAKKSRNFVQITGDYIAKNGGYWGTFKHIGSKVADTVSNGIKKVVNIFK